MTTVSFSVPLPAPAVPPRQELPGFPPIRRGCGGWHRWRSAARRSGVPALVLLAVAAALAFGPARAGLPPTGGGALGRTGCQSGAAEDHP
ncbi:hypothetical protein GCM10018790_74330 [Kitasatospora xanthocidica]|uniref:hypothetical protein n=1 Tax=Kitasatospora xanthocidica TaxID=83382 RepID=UPI0016726B27|nr:hypothetical protein [Kitasatospora xanthocidica]GHF85953.1 hypothetical protein GCM10018790_74330 [Kitasatospora xanthocidica]